MEQQIPQKQKYNVPLFQIKINLGKVLFYLINQLLNVLIYLYGLAVKLLEQHQNNNREMIQQIIVYTIIAIFIGISQSAGIGGGPILNICLMLGFGYDAKDSMSIAYVFLMGGAFASMWKNRVKKNPKTGGPLMDYSLIMITLPAAVSGSLFGTILNHFISQFVITLLFTILLSYLTHNSYEKLKAINRLENLQEKATPLISTELQTFGVPEYEKTHQSDRLDEILAYEKEVYPRDKLKVMGQIFVYTIIVLLCKGGRNYDSFIGLEQCGIGSWIFILLHFLLSYLYSKSMAMRQYRLDNEKESLGYVFENSSDKMSEQKMNSCMLYGFLAGMTGGALGLGGAIILVPVWLNKGIDKAVATSSSGPLIFFSAAVSFCLGLLSQKYSSVGAIVFYFVLAFAGSYIVKEIVTYISEKYQLKAMIFILLIITMVSSLVTLIPFQFGKYLDDPQGFMHFGRLC